MAWRFVKSRTATSVIGLCRYPRRLRPTLSTAQAPPKAVCPILRLRHTRHPTSLHPTTGLLLRQIRLYTLSYARRSRSCRPADLRLRNFTSSLPMLRSRPSSAGLSAPRLVRPPMFPRGSSPPIGHWSHSRTPQAFSATAPTTTCSTAWFAGSSSAWSIAIGMSLSPPYGMAGCPVGPGVSLSPLSLVLEPGLLAHLPCSRSLRLE
ncbi:hypothetical protein C8Q79DRAFT_189600 [Trametes meyenii]|nr:hypothetical protein C8Q79DRAFT_189600 [Trametes meyenii]